MVPAYSYRNASGTLGRVPRAFSEASFLILLVLMLLPASEMPAATIVGKVSDLEGTAIAAAQVVVREARSDYSRTAVTTEDGSYALPSLPAGLYTIVVTKPGFADFMQENVTVRDEGETVELQFRLRPAAQQTVVRGVEELSGASLQALDAIVGATAGATAAARRIAGTAAEQDGALAALTERVRASAEISRKNRDEAEDMADRAGDQARELAELERSARELEAVAEQLREVARRFANA